MIRILTHSKSALTLGSRCMPATVTARALWYSSSKRPILNMRPDYSFWAHGGPRGVSADLWHIGFLERELGSQGYDLIMDHDLNKCGAPLLKRYRVLLSGSHPGCPSYSMLNSYASFLQDAGHFMYLGGNGYYWVTAPDPSRPHLVEVRRADQGCRTFALPAGNWPSPSDQ